MATLPERGTGPFSDSCLPVTGGRWTRLREQELVEVKLGLPKEEGRWLPLGMATLGATECLILPLPPPPPPSCTVLSSEWMQASLLLQGNLGQATLRSA